MSKRLKRNIQILVTNLVKAQNATNSPMYLVEVSPWNLIRIKKVNSTYANIDPATLVANLQEILVGLMLIIIIQVAAVSIEQNIDKCLMRI